MGGKPCSFVFLCLTTLWTTKLLAPLDAIPAVIQVGALLSPEEQSEELVLNIAIDKINGDLATLRVPTSLVVRIQHIDDFDSYHAEKKVCNLAKNAVSAIIGPSNEISAIHVSSMCDALNIPHLETNFARRLKNTKQSIDFFPDPLSLVDAYADVIIRVGWKKFAIAYEDAAEVIFVHKFLELLNGRLSEHQHGGFDVTRPQIEVYQFDNDRPYREVFWEMGKKRTHNFLLHVKTENVESVFRQAQQVGMLTQLESFVLTSLDLHTIDLENYKYSKANIFYFSIINDNHPELKNLMYGWAFYARNLDKNIPPPLSFKTSTILLFDALYHFQKAIVTVDSALPLTKAPSYDQQLCLEFEPWKQGESVLNQMLYVESAGITGRVKFDPITRKRVDMMLYLHQLDEDGLMPVGNWTSFNNTGLIADDLSKNLEQQINLENSLEGKKLTVSTYLYEPFTMRVVSKRELKGNARFEGYAIDIVQALSEYLGFTYQIVINKDGKSGKRNSTTKKWNGLVGDILYGRADIGIVDMTMTKDRQEVIDFTQPFMATGIAILYKKPSKAAFSPVAFLDPFSGKVWLAVVCTTVLFSFAKHLVGRFSPYEWVTTQPCRRLDNLVENEYNVRNSFWFTTGSLLQQGSNLAPRALSTRWTAAVWYFVAMILSQSYTANLAAFLTVEIFPHDFNNAAELLKSGIDFGCLDGGSTYSFFESSLDPVYSKLGKYLAQNKALLTSSTKEGVDRVMGDEKFAFLMEAAAIDYITQRNCTLEQVGPRINDISYAIAIRKGSPYHKALDDGILKLKETGKLDRFYTKWWKEKRGALQCTKQPSSSDPLSLDSVGGVFIVLLVGFLVSIVMAFLELLYRCHEQDTGEPLKDKVLKELMFAFDFRKPTKLVRRSSPASNMAFEESL